MSRPLLDPLALYFFLSALSLAFGFQTGPDDRGALPLAIHYAGIVTLVLGCVLTRPNRLLQLKLTPASLLFSLFLAYCLLSATWSIDADATLAYCFSVTAASLALGLWASRVETHTRPAGTVAAFAILLGLAALPFALPWSGRSFGFVTPNLLASYGFVVVVLASMFARRWRWPLITAGLTLVVLTQGRTIFVVTVVYLALTMVPRLFRTPNAQAVLALASAACALLGFVAWAEISNLITSWSSWLLGVADLARLDSTLTGRTDLWVQGAQLVEAHPFFGYGFATRDGYTDTLGSLNAHSGVINLLLDLGIVGAALYVGAICFAISANFRTFHHTGSDLAWKRLAFLVAHLVLLVPEPNYFALSHPISILLMMCLAASLFRPEGKPKALAAQHSPRLLSPGFV